MMAHGTDNYDDSDEVWDFLYEHPWVTRFIVFELLLFASSIVLAAYEGTSEPGNVEAIAGVAAGMIFIYAVMFALGGLFLYLAYMGLKRYERGG